ncbi:DNA helicase [Trifolium repens]|nr:DNA helicase [Trifolium repens]
MSSEQRERELLRMRENYNQSKRKGKQVETSANTAASRVPFQNLTNINFTTPRFQGTHDFEAGPSVRHINDTALGRRFSSNFQGSHDNEAGPSRTNITDIVQDSLEFDENFEEAHIPDVAIESTTNVTSPRYRRQGLQDALYVGETNAENVGKRTILPSTFIGGPRDMTQRYEDGMAIVLRDDKIRYREIFQLCRELKTKNFDAYFENQEGDFQNRWNTWKDEQSMSSICKIDNKVHRLRVYFIGWGATIITDKTQLWKMVKREILSQRTTRNLQNAAATTTHQSTISFKLKQDISILQFFKTQEFIDKGMYEELVRIFTRTKLQGNDK